MYASVLLAATLTPGGLPPVTAPADAPFGYTYRPTRDLALVARLPAAAYAPQPGDVLLMSNSNAVSRFVYALGFTGMPGHVGIVAHMPDGRLGVLEAGFDISLTTRLVPLDYRLNQYGGSIWVRRVKVPLTPDQDARLAAYAWQADNTPYNAIEVAKQLTPFGSRGPLRTAHVGMPRGPGHRVFCSEAVVEALVYAGAIDAATARPSATYPRDLFFDTSPNPYLDRHPPLACGWEPPALWTPTVGVAARGRDRGPPPAGAVILPPELPRGTNRFRPFK